MKEKVWEEMTLEEKREQIRWIIDETKELRIFLEKLEDETEELRIRCEKLEDPMGKGGDCYE